MHTSVQDLGTKGRDNDTRRINLVRQEGVDEGDIRGVCLNNEIELGRWAVCTLPTDYIILAPIIHG